jgi:hypothetical protein
VPSATLLTHRESTSSVCLFTHPELLVVDELADKDNKDQPAMSVTWASSFVPSSAVESQHHFHLCVRRYTNDIVSEVRKPHRIQTSWVFNTENVTRGSVLILVQPLHSTRFWMPELIFPVPTQSLDTPGQSKLPAVPQYSFIQLLYSFIILISPLHCAYAAGNSPRPTTLTRSILQHLSYCLFL